jgi:hypothetical protein
MDTCGDEEEADTVEATPEGGETAYFAATPEGEAARPAAAAAAAAVEEDETVAAAASA